MPILHVRALPQKDPSRVGLALKQTCLAIAKFYDCDPSQVWATFDEIRPGCYVEGDSAPLAQPSDTHPPIAQLTCFKGTPPEKVEELLGRVLISLDLTRKILSEAN
jgi:phenylpyruvate tautomerase PptA (4-oxalocrotonate tautomerase family)